MPSAAYFRIFAKIVHISQIENRFGDMIWEIIDKICRWTKIVFAMWIIIFTFAMNVSIVFSSLSKNQTIKTNDQ